MDLAAWFLLIAVVLCDLLQSRALAKPAESAGGCEMPTLSMGSIQSMKRNKLLRFNCRLGYKLWGHKYASCVKGSWDVPLPACIKNGCPTFPALPNGMIYYMESRSVVMFFCRPGFRIDGATNAYCNGKRWNGTMPSCVGDETSKAQTSCDFEDTSICGWSHDPNHDFDWRRQNRHTPSGHLGTGPSFDHTLGEGKEGYYMYIESTSQLENDTARLISPLYPRSLSDANACFLFYYHMYGRTTGSLHVFVHPRSVDFGDLRADAALRAKYEAFSRSGDQGDRWYRGFFDVQPMDDDFQIVIEGIRGPGYISDIAIDDIALLYGEKCMEEKSQLDFTTPFTTEDSCINRCNITIEKSNFCKCDLSCMEDFSLCCVDYKDFCIVFEGVSPTQEIYLTAPPPLPTSQMMTHTKRIEFSDTVKYPDEYYASTPKPTVSPTPSTTTMATTKAVKAKNTIPPLKFASPATPLINATGVLTKVTRTSTTIKPTEKVTTLVAKVAENESDVEEVEEPKTTEETEIFSAETFSKAYIHYGRNETGHVMEKSQKMAQGLARPTYYQDAHDTDEPDNGTSVITILAIITIVSIVIVAAFISIRGHAKDIPMWTGNLPSLRQSWNNRTLMLSSSSQLENGDMRFLVQDEELEHDID